MHVMGMLSRFFELEMDFLVAVWLQVFALEVSGKYLATTLAIVHLWHRLEAYVGGIHRNRSNNRVPRKTPVKGISSNRGKPKLFSLFIPCRSPVLVYPFAGGLAAPAAKSKHVFIRSTRLSVYTVVCEHG